MAYTYSDYAEQTTDALRLERARLFKSELIASIGPDISSDGKSRNNGSLTQLLATVNEDIKRYEMSPSTRTHGGISRARFGYS